MKILAILSILLICLQSYAYNDVVKSGETNAQVKQKLITLFKEGGTLTIEEGSWTINMTNTEATLKKDVTISGANVNEGVFKHGAFDGVSNKTRLIFTGSRFTISSTCNTVKLENLEWNGRGFNSANSYHPNVDFNNVIFDLSNAADDYVNKMVIKSINGFSGSMKNCSFIHFGSAAMALNRSLEENQAPVTTRSKLIIDQCLFNPELKYKTSGCEALPHDAGNDEYPIVWDQGGSEFKNSLFIDCRISASKGKNFKILNNVFEVEHAKDAIHLEEFSENVLIQGNTFKVIAGGKAELITLGAQQSSHDIDIIDNTVVQNGWTGKFVTGAGNYNILIEGNTVQNPTPGVDYIGFWSCNNINIQVKPGQPGLGTDNVSVDESICSEIFKEGTYVVKWSSDMYLKSVGTAVTFETLSQVPASSEFMWEIKKHFYMGRFNYYSFRNLSTEKYLQVAKGPMGREHIAANYGKPFVYFGKPVIATTLLDFDENDRVPGFGLFKKDGKYALLPGGNEKKSQIIKDGDNVVVYVVESENTSSYEWSLIPSKENSDVGINKPVDEEISVCFNSDSGYLNIINSNQTEWKIYDIKGRLHKEGEAPKEYLGQLSSGVYVIAFETGERKKILIP